MTVTPTTRTGASVVGGEGLVAALLVVTLLLCHGLFGFAHELSCHDCGSPAPPANASQEGHENLPAHPVGHHASGHPPADWHAFTGYFGVVLALFGFAALGLLFRARRWCGDEVRRLHRPRPLPSLTPLPRGPTLPLLQVFRL